MSASVVGTNPPLLPRERLESLLLDTLPPLYRKVRPAVVRALVDRMRNEARVQAADPLRAESGGAQDPEQSRALEAAAALWGLSELLLELRTEVGAVEAQMASLVRDYDAAPTADAKQAVVIRAIEQSGRSALERRKDLDALDRWMGFDALKERLEHRRQRLLIEEEMALRCLAGVMPRCAPTPALSHRLGAIGTVLLDRCANPVRTQNQLAALEAFGALVTLCPLSPRARAEAATALNGLVGQELAGPFLQAQALEALLRTDPVAGGAVLRQRLGSPQPSGKDFLFRREAVAIAAELLPEAQTLALYDALSRQDPSEYVRMGLCERAVALPGRLPLLRRLAGLEPGHPEVSHRVRASAVLALFAAMARDPAQAPASCSLVGELLGSERDPLVLRVACEKLKALADVLAESDVAPGVGPASPLHPLTSALAGLRLRPEVSGVVLESAAIAEQALRRVTDPVRLAWTRHLARTARALPVGGQTRIALDALPDGVPALPEDPRFLGAILADLSSADFGLYARRTGRFLELRRGDVFKRRGWRVLQELGRPAPNKRQSFLHTIGRTFPHPLRAHPARLDEITETQVPGERVHIASAGNWCRHLPLIDDLLDLPPTGDGLVHVFSSHGVTTMTPPASLAKRLGNRLRLTRDYEALAKLRLGSLNGAEARERRRFAQTVQAELGIGLRFEPWVAGEAVPEQVASLFDVQEEGTLTPPSTNGAGGTAVSIALLPLSLMDYATRLTDTISERSRYFVEPGGNGLGALALFTAGLFTYFLVKAYLQREGVRRARAAIPLTIGGWGTRGKSGTERLKAALFSGLGFDVFAKTTGSEAMFVHSAPGALPSEFFIFRPYDKATIWEQRDMVELGRKLHTEVFLWECMALQPAFVDLLQNDWMHDDLVTLTNAYPDHEDIQGPAGADVASTITNFMTDGGTVITSEDHFLPLFQARAKEKGARLLHSPAVEAELIPPEVLALFPYAEHPRNMALVATLGEQLGIRRTQAIALMAEHVQPEIGVLKVFPSARVRGRTLSFINGHSANERTGFLNNWLRTQLDQVDPEAHPDRAVLTVINNRWDRVARSEVFARIMVEDAPADRHVLIGTNLEGLQKYVRDALEQYLGQLEIVNAEDLSGGAAEALRPEGRLLKELKRLKIPRPSVDTFLDRLGRYARGADRTLVVSPALRDAVAAALEADAPELAVGEVRARLESTLGDLITGALQAGPAAATAELPELLTPASVDEVRHHALFLLARMVVAARLLRLLPGPGAPDQHPARISRFHAQFRAAHTALFLEQLVPVHDSHATGDQVVDACARAAAPGLTVSIMGSQNIKGTGLDWVYRWIALDRVKTMLETVATGRPDARRRALEVLDGFADHGLIDTGLARAQLPRLAAQAATAADAEVLGRLAEKAKGLHQARVTALGSTGKAGASRADKVVAWLEGMLDYLDSIDRRRINQWLLRDLIDGRVSHVRAALETRKLYERSKGGWLVESFGGLYALVQRLARRPAEKAPAQGTPILGGSEDAVVEVEITEAPLAEAPSAEVLTVPGGRSGQERASTRLFELDPSTPARISLPSQPERGANALRQDPQATGPRSGQSAEPSPQPDGADGLDES